MLPIECLDRQAVAALQGARLSQLLAMMAGRNAFYTRKFENAGIDIGALRLPEEVSRLPFTLRAELVADQRANPPWGTALTEPVEHILATVRPRPRVVDRSGGSTPTRAGSRCSSDIVIRRSDFCTCGRTWARLERGVLARVDDMINIRGVNVYPAGIEAVVRGIGDVTEFCSTVTRPHEMRSLRVEIEVARLGADESAVARKVAAGLREALGMTVAVDVVAAGTLPRFDMKARRFIVEE